MKKLVIPFFVFVISILSFAQIQNEFRASMGIDLVSVPELKDFLELNYSPDRLSDFSSAVNFSGAYGRMIGDNNQLELEFGYLINSYNYPEDNGTYDLSYTLIMPSLLYNYIIVGNGYNFKFGGGAGLRFLSITEKQPGQFDEKKESFGYGFILRAVGNTAIAQNVFAHIGADIRYDLLGKPDDSATGNKVENVNFNSLSFGIRLGISYQF